LLQSLIIDWKTTSDVGLEVVLPCLRSAARLDTLGLSFSPELYPTLPPGTISVLRWLAENCPNLKTLRTLVLSSSAHDHHLGYDGACTPEDLLELANAFPGLTRLELQPGPDLVNSTADEVREYFCRFGEAASSLQTLRLGDMEGEQNKAARLMAILKGLSVHLGTKLQHLKLDDFSLDLTLIDSESQFPQLKTVFVLDLDSQGLTVEEAYEKLRLFAPILESVDWYVVGTGSPVTATVAERVRSESKCWHGMTALIDHFFF
jgi:hypothetical protein